MSLFDDLTNAMMLCKIIIIDKQNPNALFFLLAKSYGRKEEEAIDIIQWKNKKSKQETCACLTVFDKVKCKSYNTAITCDLTRNENPKFVYNLRTDWAANELY